MKYITDAVTADTWKIYTNDTLNEAKKVFAIRMRVYEIDEKDSVKITNSFAYEDYKGVSNYLKENYEPVYVE